MDSTKQINIQCYICNAVFDDNHKLWNHINEENCEKSTPRNVLVPIGNQSTISLIPPMSLNNAGVEQENLRPQIDKLVQLLPKPVTPSQLSDQYKMRDDNSQPIPGPAPITSSEPNFSSYCDVCMISLPSLCSFQSHITGKKHLKSLKRQADQENIAPVSPTSYHIATRVTSVAQSQSIGQPDSASASEPLHLNPAKHLVRKAEPSTDTQAAKRVRITPEAESYFCDLCGVSATSEVVFSSHIRGKRHAYMLAQLKYVKMQTAVCEKRQSAQVEAPAQVKPSIPHDDSSSCTSYTTESEAPSVSSALPTARVPISVPITSVHGPPSTSSSPSSTPPTSDLRPVLRQLCLTQIMSLLSKVYPSYPGLPQLAQSSSLMNNGLSTERLFASLVQTISQDMCNGGGRSLSTTASSSPVANPCPTLGSDSMHSLMLLCWCQQLMSLLPEHNQQQQQKRTGAGGIGGV